MTTTANVVLVETLNIALEVRPIDEYNVGITNDSEPGDHSVSKDDDDEEEEGTHLMDPSANRTTLEELEEERRIVASSLNDITIVSYLEPSEPEND